MDMIDWSKISDICKYVVDGDNAKRVYDVLRESYVGTNRKLPSSKGEQEYQIEYCYEDEVLYIEEHIAGGSGGYVDELISFLIPFDSYYAFHERSNDGVPMSYEVRDDEGKYFVRPSECEKIMIGEEQNNDIPF